MDAPDDAHDEGGEEQLRAQQRYLKINAKQARRVVVLKDGDEQNARPDPDATAAAAAGVALPLGSGCGCGCVGRAPGVELGAGKRPENGVGSWGLDNSVVMEVGGPLEGRSCREEDCNEGFHAPAGGAVCRLVGAVGGCRDAGNMSSGGDDTAPRHLRGRGRMKHADYTA